jgi:hypothetical protein
MPITFQCECGKNLRVPDEHAGKRARCPACGREMTIPGPQPVASSAPVAVSVPVVQPVKTLPMSEAIRFGWNTMKSALLFFIGVLIVYEAIDIAPTIVSRLLQKDAPILSFLITLAGIFITCVLDLGLIKISLKFVDKSKGTFGNLFGCFHLLSKYILASVLYILLVLAGIILLIVPGIIWGIKYGLYAYVIVDEEVGPLAALKKSGAITLGVKWDLFLFGLLLGLMNLAGALCLCVGLFATIPTTMVAMAYAYRTLRTQTEMARAT